MDAAAKPEGTRVQRNTLLQLTQISEFSYRRNGKKYLNHLYLQPGLVAVFVGATDGVGETTVRQFAKYAASPRVYIVGRSQEAGERVAQECRDVNPEGTFIFIKHETSLISNVENLCNKLAAEEKTVNVLFLTVGTLEIAGTTQEGLHYASALTIYARNHSISQLLPLIRQANGLRRVVTTFGATFEGDINMSDFQGTDLSPPAKMRHTAAITTLALEAHQAAAPELSLVHNFPGAVKSGFNVFFPGGWSVKRFFLGYTFLAAFPLALIWWVLFNKTQYQRLRIADLSLAGDVQEIDESERLVEVEPLIGISGWMERLFGGVWESQAK
ncbi:hypothetical protein B0A50_07171 [Salinomyces thailandicus]|uniref:Oxidoreductase n=1 Tax=Salinomyces thailandicus TaxID=706561 RepID=A0A4U0TME2_9PEZI|nr:hypothetical protein B0A50_07171 [Salinomyces thailandica]